MIISLFKKNTILVAILILLFNVLTPMLSIALAMPPLPDDLRTPANEQCYNGCATGPGGNCWCRLIKYTGADGRSYACTSTTLPTGKICIAGDKAPVVNPITKPVNTCPDNMLYDSALGCIPPTTTGITNFTLRLLIGLAMGVAVFKGTFAIWKWRNAESPDKKQDAIRELMAVFMGLVILFIGIPILAFVGIDILNLDQFTNGELVKIFN